MNSKSLVLAIALVLDANAVQLGTAFTYQGRLTVAGSPANQNYDLRFAIYDSPIAGGQVGGTVTNLAVGVSNGLFTVELDFGPAAFDGSARWIEIGVRPGGSSDDYTLLTPRQPVLPAPNALFAPNAAIAATANGVAASVITATQLNTPGAPACGQVLAYDGAGLVWTNASNVAGAWELKGNAGTTPGSNYLGTTDQQPLEFRVNNTRGFRLEPTSVPGAVNVLAGSPGNFIRPDLFGVTISGGGIQYADGSGDTNAVFALHATIGGGRANFIGTNAAGAVVSGGSANRVETFAYESVIAGGGQNVVREDCVRVVIGGGWFNTVLPVSDFSVISGGWSNSTASLSTAISGGSRNSIGAESRFSTIGGGGDNVVGEGSITATIAGGGENRIRSGSMRCTIGGGKLNVIGTNSSHSAIAGGLANRILDSAAGAAIPGGISNTVAAAHGWAAGYRATAAHPGALVWADSSDFDFASTATNEVAVRATGGARFVSGIDGDGAPVAGVTLPAGGGSWASLSDRNAKENLKPVNAGEVLEKVAALPLATWNYKSQETPIRHIGPMAQDFHAAFRVGENDTTITTVDADGVALAAIQGLNQKLEEAIKLKNAELHERDARIAALEQNVAELKQCLDRLAIGSR